MSAQTIIVSIQAITFIGLGALFIHQGNLRLATAQWLLAGVTWAVYL